MTFLALLADYRDERRTVSCAVTAQLWSEANQTSGAEGSPGVNHNQKNPLRCPVPPLALASVILTAEVSSSLLLPRCSVAASSLKRRCSVHSLSSLWASWFSRASWNRIHRLLRVSKPTLCQTGYFREISKSSLCRSQLFVRLNISKRFRKVLFVGISWIFLY